MNPKEINKIVWTAETESDRDACIREARKKIEEVIGKSLEWRQSVRLGAITDNAMEKKKNASDSNQYSQSGLINDIAAEFLGSEYDFDYLKDATRLEIDRMKARKIGKEDVIDRHFREMDKEKEML